jgi:hypothetical protein
VGLKHKGAAVGVDPGVALSTLDLLAGVIATRPAGFSGLDALAVDHRRRRAGLTPDPLSIAHDQMVVEAGEEALAAKAQEPAIDRGRRRDILGQVAPGAAYPSVDGRLVRGV